MLALAVGSRAVICPKVGLRDVFFVPRPNDNRAAMNRIAQKHVDFLLCSPDMMRPMLGIELDDGTHHRPERRSRDELVDRVFEAGNLPLLRFAASAAYGPREILDEINRHTELGVDQARNASPLARELSPQETSTSQALTESPPCPRCGEQMIARVASRGENRGQRFWGCPNYPKCRQTLPLG